MDDVVSRGIVLRSVRYGERGRVVEVYTEAAGTRSFFVSGKGGRVAARTAHGARHLGTGSAARGRPLSDALWLPLNIVEIVWHEGGNGSGELLRPRDVAMAHAWRELYFRPQKSAVVMFLSEFLSYALRGEVGDARLMAYVATSLAWLDDAVHGIGVFPVTFLMGLAPLLGFDVRGGVWHEGCYFDLMAGSYESERPAHDHFLSPEEAAVVPKLLGVPVTMSARVHVPGWVLQRALRVVIEFYQLHLPVMPLRLKSLDVLAML